MELPQDVLSLVTTERFVGPPNKYLIRILSKLNRKVTESFLYPHAPSPSPSGLGVGFGCLKTVSQAIWSTREGSSMI